MHVLPFRPALALLVACAASFAAEAAAPMYRSGAIVFSRSPLDANGQARSSSLWMTSSAGDAGTALTSSPAGTYDQTATWSPHGTHIAFARGSTTADPEDRFDIVSLDTHSGHLRQLSTGAGNFVTPAWGPGKRIVFVSHYPHRDCLSSIDADGTGQKDLFCPPSPAKVTETPLWSQDGANVYLHAGYFIDRLGFFWRSLAWRVDATTGFAFILDDRVLEEPTHLEFSPDGSHGIYSNDVPYPDVMTLIDFTSGAATPIGNGNGYAPRWSEDGRRIAFTGEVFEANPPDFRYYEPLYVMDADGSHVRRVTRARINNHGYTAVDWSKDNVHLLVNRRIYLDPSLTIARYVMRIIDVDTGAVTSLPGGQAQPGAWFER